MYELNVKTYHDLPFCEKEILRYSGAKDFDRRLFDSILGEAKKAITYRLTYRIFPLEIKGSLCSFGGLLVNSEGLSKNLSGCKSAVIFAATLGSSLDRLISRYAVISPTRSLLLSAIGSAQIEVLCDTFSTELSQKYNLRPRFSPGYGDLPLDTQKAVFSLLDCEKKIGLYLTDSYIMTPTKSVTAFIGLSDTRSEINENKCSRCEKTDCAFRGEI